MNFGEEEAWDAISRGVRDFERSPEETRSKVLSITVAGSLVRGDFVADRSDVDLYTLYEAGALNDAVHQRVRACFDPHFAPYKGHSHNPFVWDDVCLTPDSLPRTAEELARSPLKAFGIYGFDFVRHHRTLWGEDLARFLPEPVDPKDLVRPRLDDLIRKAERMTPNDPESLLRLPMLAVEAVKALQIFFGGEPSIHKAHVLQRYIDAVPEFPEKPFGLTAWNDYLQEGTASTGRPPGAAEEYRRFLDAARGCLRAHAD